MSARQVRVETRSRHQSDLKRVMHSTARVRKWEKKWVQVGDTSMHIFKWMPIKSDNHQSNDANSLIQPLNQRQQSLRGILSAANNNLMNTNGISTTNDRLENKFSESKMLLTTNNEHIQATATNVNGSQQGLEQQKNNKTSVGIANNSTSMTPTTDNNNPNPNKRKLNDLDLMSSDSCGSSTCSSSLANNMDTNIDSNSALDMEVHQRATKRRKESPSVSVDYFDMSHNAPQMTSSNVTSGASTPNHTSDRSAKAEQQEDVRMLVVEDANSVQNNNCQTTTMCIDLEQDLNDVARLVTEQIVTRVSDCYMNI